jgi:hypothetical protein
LQNIWNRPLASAMVLVPDTALSRWKVGPYLGAFVLRRLMIKNLFSPSSRWVDWAIWNHEWRR